jgi:hypothetical protein
MMSELYRRFNDRIRAISQQGFYEFFSYSTRRLINELLDQIDNIKLLKTQSFLPLISILATFSYTIYFSDHYLFYMFPFVSSIIYIPKTIMYLDILIIALMIIGIYKVYTILTKLSKMKKSFDDLRNCLIKTINGEFCSHSMSCECKQNFIQYMDERENINLSF